LGFLDLSVCIGIIHDRLRPSLSLGPANTSRWRCIEISTTKVHSLGFAAGLHYFHGQCERPPLSRLCLSPRSRDPNTTKQWAERPTRRCREEANATREKETHEERGGPLNGHVERSSMQRRQQNSRRQDDEGVGREYHSTIHPHNTHTSSSSDTSSCSASSVGHLHLHLHPHPLPRTPTRTPTQHPSPRPLHQRTGYHGH